MFDSVTTIGLLLTLVMIFSFQGNTILEKPLHIVLIAVSLILQTFLIFAIVAFMAGSVVGALAQNMNWLPGFEAALQDCCSRRNDLCFQLL